MGRSVDIPTGMESEAEDPDGSDDDTSSILTASTSAEGVNVSHVTSVTSFSLEDYPTTALVFDLDCIAQAISYDERCRAPLQRLADMDSGDRLEQHLMTLLNYLPFDFREFATGSEEMELSRFICKEKDRIALAICETLDGTGQTPVTSQRPRNTASDQEQATGALSFLLSTPAVLTFVERLDELSQPKPERTPETLHVPIRVKASCTCVSLHRPNNLQQR
jgi:hypothetical protein